MKVLDATSLAERLEWEGKEYRLHLEAETPLDKYPGKSLRLRNSAEMLLMEFAAKQHARRVQEKLGVVEGLIYLLGQRSRNNDDSDMPAPYQQLRYFYYLTGFVRSYLDAMT
jgi:Xaa-Pro dipeptidase